MLSNQSISDSRKIEILRRQATGIMGHQPQAYSVIANVDIRVVAGLFSPLAYPVDKGQWRPRSP